MTKKEEKKQIDDTMLEYYGFTDEDIEKIKNEWTYSSEEVDKILYIRDLFAKQWIYIYIDDFDKFEEIVKDLEMYNEIKNV